MKGFVKATALNNASNRVDYIKDKERQEHLEAFHSGGLSDEYWQNNHEQCSRKAKQYIGNNNKYKTKTNVEKHKKQIEAYELVMYHPHDILAKKNITAEQFAKDINDIVSKTTECDCCTAVHWNSDMTNFHTHTIVNERHLLEVPKVKIAERNLFFNEKGKRVYSKKEILNDDKSVKKDCKIIKKGEVYEINYWSSKSRFFKDKNDMKSNLDILKEKIGDYNGLEIGNYNTQYQFKTANLSVSKYRMLEKKNSETLSEFKAERDAKTKYNAFIKKELSDKNITLDEAVSLKKELSSTLDYSNKMSLVDRILEFMTTVLNKIHLTNDYSNAKSSEFYAKEYLRKRPFNNKIKGELDMFKSQYEKMIYKVFEKNKINNDSLNKDFSEKLDKQLNIFKSK